MSNKITIELTEAQLSNLNSIISIAGLAHQNPVLVRSTLPEKLQVDGSYAVPNEIDVDYLITKGSIGDRGAYGSDAFIRMFERVAKKHPVVAKEYIEKLFLPANKREFTFTADFRKGIAAIGLKHDILPDSAKLYYIKTFAYSETNEDWVMTHIRNGNIPDSAWDILAKSKRYKVCKTVIEKGPENILPVVATTIPNISRDKIYGAPYDYKTSTYLAVEYLEYLFEHRIAVVNKKISNWSPLNPYSWMAARKV
jgi:hypothetical protein